MREFKEGTRAEIARFMGRHTDRIGSVLHRMNRKSDRKPKRIYILRYQHDDVDGRHYPRAVYALGERQNAKKPRAKTAVEYSRDYRERNKLQVPSIFAMRGAIQICCSDRP